MNKHDKLLEARRYDERAKTILVSNMNLMGSDISPGSFSIPLILRAPYIKYETVIGESIKTHHNVLELGAGTGTHTYALVTTGAQVISTDISVHSLKILKKKFGEKVKIQLADMEYLPFKPKTFDVVVSAGSLSYGNPVIVINEIMRVLKSNGMFICVDSLNHNPIYRINRWFHYLRGERTKSTLQNMPTINLLMSMSKQFNYSDVYYFGSLSWIMPFFVKIIGQNKAAKISDFIDHIIKVKRSAFKFVFIAKGRL